MPPAPQCHSPPPFALATLLLTCSRKLVTLPTSRWNSTTAVRAVSPQTTLATVHNITTRPIYVGGGRLRKEGRQGTRVDMSFVLCLVWGGKGTTAAIAKLINTDTKTNQAAAEHVRHPRNNSAQILLYSCAASCRATGYSALVSGPGPIKCHAAQRSTKEIHLKTCPEGRIEHNILPRIPFLPPFYLMHPKSRRLRLVGEPREGAGEVREQHREQQRQQKIHRREKQVDHGQHPGLYIRVFRRASFHSFDCFRRRRRRRRTGTSRTKRKKREKKSHGQEGVGGGEAGIEAAR